MRFIFNLILSGILLVTPTVMYFQDIVETKDTQILNVQEQNFDLQQANTDLQQANTDLQQANTDLQEQNTDLQEQNTDLQEQNNDLQEQNANYYNLLYDTYVFNFYDNTTSYIYETDSFNGSPYYTYQQTYSGDIDFSSFRFNMTLILETDYSAFLDFTFVYTNGLTTDFVRLIAGDISLLDQDIFNAVAENGYFWSLIENALVYSNLFNSVSIYKDNSMLQVFPSYTIEELLIINMPFIEELNAIYYEAGDTAIRSFSSQYANIDIIIN